MASVRSGPGGIARALLSAAEASASKSNLVRWSFLSEDMEPNSPAVMEPKLNLSTPGCLFGIRHQSRAKPKKSSAWPTLSGIRQTRQNFEDDGRFVGNKTSAEYINGVLFSPC